MDERRGLSGEAGMILAARAQFDERRRIALIRTGALIVFLLAIEAASHGFAYIPSLLQIARATYAVFADLRFYEHLAITLYEALVGFGVGTAIGVSLGVAIGSSPLAREACTPLILAVYSIPKIVFLPLMLMVFGAGLESKMANAALHTIFPVLLNTLVGMREVKPVLVKAARSMNASRLAVLRKIVLPSMALPVFAGMRIGLGFALLGTLLAEIFEAQKGLGYLVNFYYSRGVIGEMLVVIAMVFILTISINAGLKTVEDRMGRWRNA